MSRPRTTFVEIWLPGLAALGLAAAPLAAWEAFSGPGLLLAGGAYSTLLFAAGRRLWRAGHHGAGGLLVAAAAIMVPFAVHGLEHTIGFFPVDALPPHDLRALIRDPGFLVDASGIAALAIAAWRFPFAPLALLITGDVWILAMRAAPIAFGSQTGWSERVWVSAAIGSLAIAAGFAAARWSRAELAWWLHLAGLIALLGGLATLPDRTRWGIILQIAMCVALVGLALVARRRTFAVFGALALAGAAGRLAVELGDGKAPAVIAVAALAAAAVFAGALLWARLEERVGEALRARLPAGLTRWLSP